MTVLDSTARLLVVGASGQVASELARAVLPQGFSLLTAGRPDLDIADRTAVHELVARSGAAVVINAAAYTAVDRAETDPEAAFAVNAKGPGFLAEATAALQRPLIHVSTDYVFDGTKRGAYREDDPVAPLGVYGASKEAGERAVREGNPRHVILRTAWVYSPFGTNFVRTMLRLGAERDELRVVADQHGCPTAAGDLAAAIVAIAARLAGPGPAAGPAEVLGRDGEAPWGTYHLAGTGETTWHGLAEAVFERAAPWLGRRPVVHPITTAEYPTPARRPANSVLDCALAARRFGVQLRPWRAAVDAVVDELGDARPS